MFNGTLQEFNNMIKYNIKNKIKTLSPRKHLPKTTAISTPEIIPPKQLQPNKVKKTTKPIPQKIIVIGFFIYLFTLQISYYFYYLENAQS